MPRTRRAYQSDANDRTCGTRSINHLVGELLEVALPGFNGRVTLSNSRRCRRPKRR